MHIFISYKEIRQIKKALKKGFDTINYLTASFNALPALKAGTLLAGISISLPVCGLRPLRAALSRTSKLPKPINCTFSPSDKDF